MAKKIKPLHGTPINECLENEIEDACNLQLIVDGEFEEAEEIQAGREAIAIALKKKVNQDVCLSPAQINFLKSTILDGVHKNFEPKTVSNDILRDILTLCNSFSLKCANCLNADCEMRDPEVPVPKAPEDFKDESDQ